MHRPRILLVTRDPALRALAREAIRDQATELFEAPLDDLRTFTGPLELDFVIMIGTMTRAARGELLAGLAERALAPQRIIIAATVAEARRTLLRMLRSISQS